MLRLVGLGILFALSIVIIIAFIVMYFKVKSATNPKRAI